MSGNKKTVNRRFPFFLFLILLALASCRFKQNTGSGQDFTIPSMEDVSRVLEEATGIKQDPCPTLQVDLPTPKKYPVIKDSYKGAWPQSYSIAIGKQIEKKYMRQFLKQPIAEEDLGFLGCRGYNYATDEEKKQFWMIFMSAVALPESSFDKMLKTYETDQTYSTGLLQIDPASAERWCQDLKKELKIASFESHDMMNPVINLQCGLIIMFHQIMGVPKIDKNNKINEVREDLKGHIFSDRRFYWKVLEKNDKKYTVINWFKKHASLQLPFCSKISISVPNVSVKTVIKSTLEPTDSFRGINCTSLTTPKDQQDCEKANLEFKKDNGIELKDQIALGEQNPTKKESCDLVNDTHIPKPPIGESNQAEDATGKNLKR